MTLDELAKDQKDDTPGTPTGVPLGHQETLRFPKGHVRSPLWPGLQSGRVFGSETPPIMGRLQTSLARRSMAMSDAHLGAVELDGYEWD